MAAFASPLGDPARPAVRVQVLVHRWRLDHELAAGADPRSSDARTLRAAQLVRPRLADDLRRAVTAPGRPRGAGVPVCRAEVLDAAPALLALADDLDDVRDPAARGVALTLALLRDGGGPLYRPSGPGRLHDAAEEARYAL